MAYVKFKALLGNFGAKGDRSGTLGPWGGSGEALGRLWGDSAGRLLGSIGAVLAGLGPTCGLQVLPKWTQVAPRGPKEAPKKVPRGVQDGPNRAQEATKRHIE